MATRPGRPARSRCSPASRAWPRSGALAGPTDALYEYFNDSSFSAGLVPWDLDGATFGFTPSGGGYLHHNP